MAREGDDARRMEIARHVGLVGAALESTSGLAQDRLAAEVQVSAILLVAQLARTSYCRTLLLARGVLKRLAEAAAGCSRAHERAVLTAVARALVLLAEDGPLQSMARTVPSSSSVQALARCRAILMKSRFPSVQDVLSGGSGLLLGQGGTGAGGVGPSSPALLRSQTSVKRPPLSLSVGRPVTGAVVGAYTAVKAPSVTPGFGAFGGHEAAGLDKGGHLTSIVSRLDSRLLAERSEGGTPRTNAAAAGTPGLAPASSGPTVFQAFSTPVGTYFPEQRVPSSLWREATPLPLAAEGRALAGSVAKAEAPPPAVSSSVPPVSSGDSCDDVVKIKAFMTWMGHAAHIHRQRRLLARSRRRLQNRIKHRLQKDAFHNWRMAVSGAVIAAQERMSADTGEIFENNLSNLSLENAELRKALLACQQDSEEAHRHGEMAQNQLKYILCKVADLGEVLSEIEGGGEALIAACSILEDVLKHHTTEATKLNDLVARKALASEAKGQGAEGASPRLSSWLMTPTGKG